MSLRENNGSLMNVFSLAASCGGPLTRGSKMEGTIVQWTLHHTHVNVTHLTLPACHCPQNYMCKCILLSCKLPPICGTLTSPSSFAEEKNVRLWCPLKAHMAPAWPSCYNNCSISALSCLACWDNCHKSAVDINMLILNCWGESFKTIWFPSRSPQYQHDLHVVETLPTK